MTDAERITSLEVQVKYMSESQSKLLSEQHDTNEKLDDLLALRNKGAGAFWLATTLAGIGAVGIFMQFMEWLGGGNG